MNVQTGSVGRKLQSENGLKPSLIEINGEVILDKQNHFPSYLALLANATSRGGSRVYLGLFGIGINEWRILSALTHEPGSSAIDICEYLVIDKAAASRSINSMEETGLLRSEPVAKSPRRRALFITAKGRMLHDKILQIVAARELVLLKGFSEDDRQLLLNLFRKIANNLDTLVEFEDQLINAQVTVEDIAFNVDLQDDGSGDQYSTILPASTR